MNRADAFYPREPHLVPGDTESISADEEEISFSLLLQLENVLVAGLVTLILPLRRSSKAPTFRNLCTLLWLVPTAMI